MTLSLPKALEPYRSSIEETLVPFVSIQATRQSTSVKDSKIGGTPYLPDGFSYPLDSSEIPMALLCQLNFEEIPHLEHFPTTGILQFYLSKNDDVMGMDFNNPTNQSNFRVIYHENSEHPHATNSFTPEDSLEEHLPFNGEYRLSFSLSKEALGVSDFQFEESYESIDMDQATGEENMWGEETLYDLFCEHVENMGHKIGGYAYFSQTDPRDYGTQFDDYRITLLQIDTDDEGENDIMWGDAGVGNFFITKEDLRKKDFSSVLFNWDCH
ncbi:YwqG family protein [Fictibacillus nanhaiensis]|uniref:YwqG family protein n=1 Tax=Fictibacillus nanhaiensis TaxID=742169 RepID=UPI002E200B08|nr:YwqG family protein [Fictibacillus nanhaiensis]